MKMQCIFRSEEEQVPADEQQRGSGGCGVFKFSVAETGGLSRGPNPESSSSDLDKTKQKKNVQEEGAEPEYTYC
jgi:hypothetical protein